MMETKEQYTGIRLKPRMIQKEILDFTTLADKEVIQGIEQDAARALGEISEEQVTRTNHYGYVGPNLYNMSVFNQSRFCAWMNNPLPVVELKNNIYDLAR